MSDLNLESTYGTIIHRDFDILYVDDNYAKIFGFKSAVDLMEKTDSLLDLIEPQHKDLAIESNAKFKSGAMHSTTQTHINVRQNGERFPVLTLHRIVDWDGAPALEVTVVDLSSAAQANKKIRDNERKYRDLIANSPQGIMIHRNFKPLLVNDAWVRLYRARSVDWVLEQDSFICRIHEAEQARAKHRYNQLINGEVDGGRVLFEAICFDGSKRIFNLYENCIEWDGEPAVQSVVEDVTERVQLERALEYKASHDKLTDLFNRDAVFEWLSQKAGSFHSLACLIIDIDNFKSINDTYGHYAGDKVIKSFAFLCENEIGDKGIVARWGGEEFLILIPDVTVDRSVDIAEGIREKFASRVCQYGDISIQATVSIGIDVDEVITQGNLLKRMLKSADARLYEAKHSGKNKVCY